ncbi:Fc.00g070740.m01.CDS01 [Cosmosporella sp. VM-42]
MVDSRSALASDLKSINDLILVEFTDPFTNTYQKTFLWVTEDDKVFFGRASSDEEMTLDDYIKALHPIPDTDLFPKVPADTPLTIVTDDQSPSFCKRPGLFQYEPGRNTGTPKLVLDETLIMETLSKNPHPNIIHYKGCRVRRGRITGILLEQHEMTLEDFVLGPEFKDLDHDAFLEAFESAVAHLHILGLAHNDINPGNIMMGKNNLPVLIDFGSCQPFGKRLQTFGTPGWVEEDFSTSEKRHDTFALGRLRQWIEDTKKKSFKSEL